MTWVTSSVGEAAVGPFLNALELPTIAVSLGDVGTPIWPIAGTGIMRPSVGLEDLADQETDCAEALTRVPAPVSTLARQQGL